MENNKEIGLHLYAVISMQNKPYPFLGHIAVLDCQKPATCFLLHLFYSQFGIMKYVNNFALTAVSRHDDVRV